ncbi:MAG: hypothetical protein O7B99_07870 [Planctomycetota bacterium]|nr:hypothetical protein [Planctomycetota bacterium]
MKPQRLLCLLLAAPLCAQDWREGLEGIDDERPFLIRWQRTLDDAEAVSRATGRPLLLCVNLDGEPASEVFARGKYKDPAFAELLAGYVPIVLSPNRHTDADYDEKGLRIPCTRFGVVTCGEHIAAEPPAFERYFEGRRVAPRHLAIGADGARLFDRFLDQDLSVVDAALRENGAPHRDARLERLIASRDVADREALERAYRAGDAGTRATLLLFSAKAETEPVDLIRLGLHEESESLRGLAVEALIAIAGPATTNLVLDALKSEETPRLRARLAEALVALADVDPRARQALRVHQASATPSTVVKVKEWRERLAAVEAVPVEAGPADREEIEARLRELDEEEETPSNVLEHARTFLAYAEWSLTMGSNPTFHLMDADGAAARARELGADAAACAVVQARAMWLLGQTRPAADHAAEALPRVLESPAGREAAETLEILAHGRTAAIYTAVTTGDDWPAAWLSDANAAYGVLGIHPRGTVDVICAHADLLGYLGATGPKWDILVAAVSRYPASTIVHRRIRNHVIARSGADALVAAYAELRERSSDPAAHSWFAGYAAMVAAGEASGPWQSDEAWNAYEEAIALFERSIAANVGYAPSARNHMARARASQARIASFADRAEAAVEKLLLAYGSRPEQSTDDLEQALREVLRDLRNALGRDARGDLLERLAELPETELEQGPDPGG